MKFNKAMTKFLSALIMASMVGTSVQIPTLAEITNAGQDNLVEKMWFTYAIG